MRAPNWIRRAERPALRVIDSWPAWLPWSLVVALGLILVDILVSECRGGYRP